MPNVAIHRGSAKHHPMLRLHWVAVVCVALCLAGPVIAGPTGPVLEGTVVGVIDGDTVDVRLDSGMIRIRLHGIDAPELSQARGRAAKEALAQLVFGLAVGVEPIEQDRYDRLVARLWLGDLDVNAELLRQGAAWVYRRYAGDPAYCRYEADAREARRGLWSLPPEQRVAPWEWRQRKSRGGVFTDYSSETARSCAAALGR
jgi:endonuclease YncB( thermonuclease family)